MDNNPIPPEKTYLKELINAINSNSSTRLLTFGIVMGVLVLLSIIWNYWLTYNTLAKITVEQFDLQQLSDEIIYLDEVLTMSARMAAATGDLVWIERYESHVGQLDIAINRAIEYVPAIQETNEANVKLVEIEMLAFDLIQQNQREQALELLLNADYATQKNIYIQGITQNLKQIELNLQQALNQYQTRSLALALTGIITLSIVIIGWRRVLSLLKSQFNNLITKEEMLRQYTQQLEQTIGQSERMATLGELVAGFTHEINTPISIGLTMASTLSDATTKLTAVVQTGKIKISDLKRYFQTAEETSQLILNNLQRATELIENFKQVSIDRTSQTSRRFEVKPYIESVLLSLKPQLDLFKHQVFIESEDNLYLDSYPGDFGQIVTNLVVNSLKHGYQPNQSITLHFELNQTKDYFQLIYTDNGRGIRSVNLSKIFEPFFSTGDKKDSSGLGLNIIYNLVTKKLKGQITCESEEGKGVKFTILIPV